MPHPSLWRISSSTSTRTGMIRNRGEEGVLGKVEAHTLEPARHGVDGEGLVDDGGVGALVDEVGGVEDGGPEGGAVRQGVGVEVAEGLGGVLLFSERCRARLSSIWKG